MHVPRPPDGHLHQGEREAEVRMGLEVADQALGLPVDLVTHHQHDDTAPTQVAVDWSVIWFLGTAGKW